MRIDRIGDGNHELVLVEFDNWRLTKLISEVPSYPEIRSSKVHVSFHCQNDIEVLKAGDKRCWNGRGSSLPVLTRIITQLLMVPIPSTETPGRTASGSWAVKYLV